jgi:hypothetical protein
MHDCHELSRAPSSQLMLLSLPMLIMSSLTFDVAESLMIFSHYGRIVSLDFNSRLVIGISRVWRWGSAPSEFLNSWAVWWYTFSFLCSYPVTVDDGKASYSFWTKHDSFCNYSMVGSVRYIDSSFRYLPPKASSILFKCWKKHITRADPLTRPYSNRITISGWRTDFLSLEVEISSRSFNNQPICEGDCQRYWSGIELTLKVNSVIKI